jgi:hypothetical protein
MNLNYELWKIASKLIIRKNILMKDLKITIPKPCHENWNQMTPSEQGRHCASCNTIVIDFSLMSAQEIQKFFKEQKGSKTCGYFKSSQLDEKLSGWHKSLLSLYQRIENRFSIPILKTCSLVFLGLLMSLSGCHKQIHKIGKIKASSPNDKTYMLKGDVDFEQTEPK